MLNLCFRDYFVCLAFVSLDHCDRWQVSRSRWSHIINTIIKYVWKKASRRKLNFFFDPLFLLPPENQSATGHFFYHYFHPDYVSIFIHAPMQNGIESNSGQWIIGEFVRVKNYSNICKILAKWNKWQFERQWT